MNKQYIGDSVYADVNEYNQLVLTTEDGLSVDQRIYLEPETWKTLLKYAVDNWGIAKRMRDQEIHTAIQESQTVRQKHNPEWLSQALNEGDGTYKP